MPSVFTHAIAGACLGACFLKPESRRTLLVVGAACAVAPDLDVAGLAFGITLDQPLGHRGLSHSVLGAGVLASAVTWAVARWRDVGLDATRIWLYLFSATMSHGLLDAMTNGGRGVAFFTPFSDRRYHFPFQPIEVSPLGVSAFFNKRGVEIIVNEVLWVWGPAFLLTFLVIWWRSRRRLAAARPSWSSS